MYFMQILVRFLLVPIFALGLCLNASRADARSANPAAHVQPGMHVSDQQIDSTIRAKLSKSKIGKDGFKFKVARGVVTWEGTTLIPQHKGAATRMARTSGAVQVVNNIQVSGGNKPGTPLKKAFVQ